MASALSNALALAAALGVIASPAIARADDALLALAWSAPAGCPSEKDVHDGALRMVPPSAGGRETLRARGVVSKSAAGYHADLSIDGDARAIDGESCDAVADAAELMLAIAIDPIAAAPAEPPPPREAPARPVAPRTSSAIFVSASGLVDGATFGGGLAPGVELGAGVLLARRVAVEIDGAWASARHASLAADSTQGASAYVLHAGARGCFYALEGAVDLGPCAGAGVTWIVASGYGADKPSDVTATLLVPALGGRASVALGRALRLRAGAEAALPLSRPTFVIDNAGTVAHTPAVALRATAGVEVRF